MSDAFADWRAIVELKARYCRLLDTKDWDGYTALFTPDVVIDTTGSGGPRLEGRETAIRTIRASLEGVVTTHHVHSPEIAIDGDAASAIWAMQDRLTSPDGRRLDGAGHYHEHYRCAQGVWRIAGSRLTRLYVDMRPASG